MHLGLKPLGKFFRERSGEPLVLAVVTATEGSTYRKPGALMLIDGQDQFMGLISGGCLESDLVKQARRVMADGMPRRVNYDLHDDEELVWGLGLGCGGDVHLLLSRLEAGAGIEVLERLFELVDSAQACRLALVISGNNSVALGSLSLQATGESLDDGSGLGRLLEAAEENGAPSAGVPTRWPQRTETLTLGDGTDALEILVIDVTPTPRILLCGAGPDTVPLAAQATGLGWDCVVVDHRPAFARSDRFPEEVEVLCQRPTSLAAAVDLLRINAAVVMSHHIEHDAAYLSQLKPVKPDYLGLLGPSARRKTLLKTIDAPDLRIHGPAGLDIGAELPEAIALAIMAEIHAVLNHREGGVLTRV